MKLALVLGLLMRAALVVLRNFRYLGEQIFDGRVEGAHDLRLSDTPPACDLIIPPTEPLFSYCLMHASSVFFINIENQFIPIYQLVLNLTIIIP